MIDLINEDQSSAERIFAIALANILQNNQGIIIHFRESADADPVGCAVARIYDEDANAWKIKVVMNSSFLESKHGETFQLVEHGEPAPPSTEPARVFH